jgi:multimeric flavodoxin WrbA
MALKVLGISASPREGGNSDLLLREALAGAQAAGGQTEYLALRGLSIAPCAECNACARTGLCRIQDDYQAVMAKMLEADRLIFATPVFFMAVSAQAKLLIDRCQCLWSRRYVLKQPLFAEPRDRRALVIAVGGSKSRKMFESVRLTMKYYLDAIGCAYAANLFVNQVDGMGEIRKHTEVLAEARRLGRGLLADSPVPKEPETVERFGLAGNQPR